MNRMEDDTESLQEVEVDALVRRLRRLGPYEVKSSSVGWWIDGACGYMVAGYYNNKKDALIGAIANIKSSKKHGHSPSWLYD